VADPPRVWSDSLYEILSEGEGAMDKRFKVHQTAGKAVRQAIKTLNLTVPQYIETTTATTSAPVPC
jgi:aspartate aminotransferase-like enzyme